jgi:AraC-like DNA-binding protein
LDSPHYFNSYELQIDKYYSTEQLQQLERMFIHNNEFPSPGAGEDEEYAENFFHSPRHLTTTIRLLNDAILSVKISNEIKLETIHKGFLSTINRRKELFEQIKQLNKKCQILHEQNESIKENNQIKFELNQQLEQNYQKQILDEQTKQNEWKKKIN